MAESLGGQVRAWDDDGTPAGPDNLAGALTASPHGAMPACKRANWLRLWITLGGDNCTGIDVQLTPAMRRRNTVVDHLPSIQIDSVAAGVTVENDSIARRDFALGTPVVPIDIPITPDTSYVVSLASRGSAGTTTAIATAEFFMR